jgi:hypothetical protein
MSLISDKKIRGIMSLQERMNAFIELGAFLKQFVDDREADTGHFLNQRHYDAFKEVLIRAETLNPWFTQANLRHAMHAICHLLSKQNISTWLSKYPDIETERSPCNVAVIMAGNIPLVGFHDMLCVLLSGHCFIGKLSSKDEVLPEYIGKLLIAIQPEFKNMISFEKGQLRDFDAVIATGSNNSARYFDYYFKNYPNIIRKNRNSVAVLTGQETTSQLDRLAQDVLLYFGLGCRNVSKIYVPDEYDFTVLFETFEKYNDLSLHNKYMNNYQYHKAIFLLNMTPHKDNGFLIVKEDESIASPVGSLFYQYYNSKEQLEKHLQDNEQAIQCIVTDDPGFTDAVSFGQSQWPQPWDYADNIDTIQFLKNL